MITNPTIESSKGDILIGHNNYNKSGRWSHPIIYISPKEGSDEVFIGAMLTHGDARRYGNTPLKPEHFVSTDSTGNPYPIQFSNSLIVTKRLLKRIDWKPFEKQGQLSQEGIFFIEAVIKDMPEEIYFDNL